MAQSQRYEISMWFQRLSVLTRRDFWEEATTFDSDKPHRAEGCGDPEGYE